MSQPGLPLGNVAMLRSRKPTHSVSQNSGDPALGKAQPLPAALPEACSQTRSGRVPGPCQSGPSCDSGKGTRPSKTLKQAGSGTELASRGQAGCLPRPGRPLGGSDPRTALGAGRRLRSGALPHARRAA